MRRGDLLLALGATVTGAVLIALASPEKIDPVPARAPLAADGRAKEIARRVPPPGDGECARSPALPPSDAPLSGRFGDWNWIVIHHTGEASGDVATLDARHRAEMGYEDGLAFHFLVGNGNGLALGAVAEGERWRRRIPGPHCTENPGVSLASVGVAAIGDTAAAPLPRESMRALAALAESLRARLGLPPERILLHREVEGGDASCPGAHFDAAAFRAALAEAAGGSASPAARAEEAPSR